MVVVVAVFIVVDVVAAVAGVVVVTVVAAVAVVVIVVAAVASVVVVAAAAVVVVVVVAVVKYILGFSSESVQVRSTYHFFHNKPFIEKMKPSWQRQVVYRENIFNWLISDLHQSLTS